MCRMTHEFIGAQGEKDHALGKELNNGLERFVANLQIKYIPEAGHWVNQVRALDACMPRLTFHPAKPRQGERTHARVPGVALSHTQVLLNGSTAIE